jgi:hypothetical protein
MAHHLIKKFDEKWTEALNWKIPKKAVYSNFMYSIEKKCKVSAPKCNYPLNIFIFKLPNWLFKKKNFLIVTTFSHQNHKNY